MLPSTAIARLSDHFGQYVIEVRCRKCQHARQLKPEVLARVVGWDAEFARVASRLRCSRCHARSVEVRIGFSRRPRRWSKNPS
jgi:Zn finger protein HypA/HybF involved in hydrogenase expression